MIKKLKRLMKRIPYAATAYRAVMKRQVQSASVASSGVVVLTDPVLPTAGSTIPIAIFIDVANAHGVQHGLPQIRVCHPAKKPGPAALSGDLLIINSITPLQHKSIRASITEAIERGTLQREDIFIYLHEDDYVFERLLGEGKGEAVEFIANLKVLPLTHHLKSRYESRGWSCTEPVFNSTIHSPFSPCPIPGSDQRLNIVTVASFQTRKGVDRAIRLAEAALELGREDVHFHWIGPHAKAVTGPLPESFPSNFTWWGAMSSEHLQHFIPAATCILLPSHSDPLPLSVWEALMVGKTCFISAEVGSSEIGSKKIHLLDFQKDAITLMKEILCDFDGGKLRLGSDSCCASTEKLMTFIHPAAFYRRMAEQIAKREYLPWEHSYNDRG